MFLYRHCQRIIPLEFVFSKEARFMAWMQLGGVVRLGSSIDRHLLDAQGPPAKPDGPITQSPRAGDAELISPGHAAKFRQPPVVNADAVGPCLAVMNFDAVCHGC